MRLLLLEYDDWYFDWEDGFLYVGYYPSWCSTGCWWGRRYERGDVLYN